MPFDLKVSDIAYRNDEISISGMIVDGAYAGPEWVKLRSTDGRDVYSIITHHSLFGIAQWPLEAGHNGSVTLHVSPLRDQATIDPKQLVVGLGFRETSEERFDLSDAVSDPRFWAMRLHEIGDDKIGGAYYEETIHSRFKSDIWPFVRIDVGSSLYVELEFAVDAEYQTRFWIGRENDQRIILGYESGHFSLPAFRFAEIELIARRARQPWLALMFLGGCRERTISDTQTDVIASLLAQTPGFKDDESSAAARLTKRCISSELLWAHDEAYGWINNSTLSQRNPSGAMSCLTDEELEGIRDFFDALAV